MDTARTPTRFVAIGDSTTEGIGDELPDGTPRGWADRFAAALAERNPDLLSANLAIRGRRTAQILAEQADAALALQPDLISAVVGVNDLVAPSLDVDEFDRVNGILTTRAAEHGVMILPLADLPAGTDRRVWRPGAAASASWIGRYLVPRTIRRLRGKSSGDGRCAKRPELVRVGPDNVRA